MMEVRQYNVAVVTGTAAAISMPLINATTGQQAVGADWTPAAGDVKVSKDGGAWANIGTLPVAQAVGNGAWWEFVFSNTELACTVLRVNIADATTKAILDDAFIVKTDGNSLGWFQSSLRGATGAADIVSLLGTAIPTPTNPGVLDVNAKTLNNRSITGSGSVAVPAQIAAPSDVSGGGVGGGTGNGIRIS